MTAIERELRAEARAYWAQLAARLGAPSLPPRPEQPPRPPPPPEPETEPAKEGRPYLYRGKPYMAGLVNGCRVRLDPLFRTRRFIRDHWTMRTVEIPTRPPSVSIAALAELPPLLVTPRRPRK